MNEKICFLFFQNDNKNDNLFQINLINEKIKKSYSNITDPVRFYKINKKKWNILTKYETPPGKGVSPTIEGGHLPKKKFVDTLYNDIKNFLGYLWTEELLQKTLISQYATTPPRSNLGAAGGRPTITLPKCDGMFSLFKPDSNENFAYTTYSSTRREGCRSVQSTDRKISPQLASEATESADSRPAGTGISAKQVAAAAIAPCGDQSAQRKPQREIESKIFSFLTASSLFFCKTSEKNLNWIFNCISSGPFLTIGAVVPDCNTLLSKKFIEKLKRYPQKVAPPGERKGVPFSLQESTKERDETLGLAATTFKKQKIDANFLFFFLKKKICSASTPVYIRKINLKGNN